MAAFLATPPRPRRRRRWPASSATSRRSTGCYRTVTAAEQQVNTQAAQLGSARGAARRRQAHPRRLERRRGVRLLRRDPRPVHAPCRTAAKKKQATKAAVTADADPRRHARSLQRGMARRPRDVGQPARGLAAPPTALRDLAGLEARYMALVARSWRHGSVSQSRRKRSRRRSRTRSSAPPPASSAAARSLLGTPAVRRAQVVVVDERRAPAAPPCAGSSTPNSSAGRSGVPHARQSTCITDSIVSPQAGHSTTSIGAAVRARLVGRHRDADQVPAPVAAARADRAAIAEDPVLARVAWHLPEP